MDKLTHKIDSDGLVTREFVDHDGSLVVDYRQDVAPIFEAVKTARNDPDNWRRQVKRDMVHAFHIPNSIVNELAAHGVNVYSASLKDVVKALRAIDKYELCDMTGKRAV